jgi:hypothetical protein
MKKDIEVVPYARIKIENLQHAGNLIVVDFSLSRSKNQSYERHRIIQCCLLWNASPYIDNQTVNFSGRIVTEITDETEALSQIQSITLDLSDEANQKLLKEKANIIHGNENVIYIRLCVATQADDDNAVYTNYSSVYPVKIPFIQ